MSGILLGDHMNYYNIGDRDSEQFNRMLVESLSEMISISVRGPDKKFVFVSEEFLKGLKLKPADVEGKGSTELIQEKLYESSASERAFSEGTDAKEFFHAIDDQWVYSESKIIKDFKGELEYVVTYSVLPHELLKEIDKMRLHLEYYKQENKQLYNYLIKNDNIHVFADKSMSKIVKNAVKIAPTNASVVITGESGVGKEIIAKVIHENSDRREKPFVAVCIPQMSPALMESELFGYEKGAFTGALSSGHEGLLESANGGTVFLDEIGDISLDLQVKLLRVLENRKFTRVGGTKTIELDVRFIAATNKNLKQMVKDNSFREDLLYRIGVIFLNIPPLRERKDDIIPLVNHFVSLLNKIYCSHHRVAEDAYHLFREYAWPGNVRELRNLVEKLVVLSEENLINAQMVNRLLQGEDFLVADTTIGTRQDHEAIWEENTVIDKYNQIESDKILTALVEAGGNRTIAAEMLGISRSTLYRRLKKHPINK